MQSTARQHIFDSTMGSTDDSTWLDRKVLRRELTDSLNRQSLSKRANNAIQSAEAFLDDLTKRAQMRDGIERKSAQIRRQHEQTLRQKAEEYRERLRRKLPPELRD